jgi:hypothetical protein
MYGWWWFAGVNCGKAERRYIGCGGLLELTVGGQDGRCIGCGGLLELTVGGQNYDDEMEENVGISR